jgi:hypothetical protein
VPKWRHLRSFSQLYHQHKLKQTWWYLVVDEEWCVGLGRNKTKSMKFRVDLGESRKRRLF